MLCGNHFLVWIVFNMQKYTFGDLSLKTLKSLVKLEQKGIADYAWTEVEHIPITEDEKFQLNYIKNQLKNYPTHVLKSVVCNYLSE